MKITVSGNLFELGGNLEIYVKQIKNHPFHPHKPPFTKRCLMQNCRLWYINIRGITIMNLGENKLKLDMALPHCAKKLKTTINPFYFTVLKTYLCVF